MSSSAKAGIQYARPTGSIIDALEFWITRTSRVTTAEIVLAASPARSFARRPFPPQNQRAQGRPGARRTRGLACIKVDRCAHEHTGLAETHRPSLRNGFTAYTSSPW